MADMTISSTNVSADYADGYREAIKHAAEQCRKYGYALDGGNNQYVYSRDALLMADLIEKCAKVATAGAPSQSDHFAGDGNMIETAKQDGYVRISSDSWAHLATRYPDAAQLLIEREKGNG